MTNRAIIATEANLPLIAAESGHSLRNLEGNLMCHLADVGGLPIVFLSGTKEDGNLVVTWQESKYFARRYPDVVPNEIDFVNVPRLPR